MEAFKHSRIGHIVRAVSKRGSTRGHDLEERVEMFGLVGILSSATVHLCNPLGFFLAVSDGLEVDDVDCSDGGF